MTEKIGVFGGTFDPIHIGHLAPVLDTATALQLTRVLFVPNQRPPHKQGRTISGTEHRVAMVQLAIARNARFQLSTVEVDRPGLSYTLDTLRQLRAELPEGTDLYFLAGCDALRDLHTWHQPQAILDEFNFVVMDRPTGSALEWDTLQAYFPGVRQQVQVVEVPLLQISAEELRRRVGAGEPITYYVVPEVDDYIRRHRLYQADSGGDR